MAQENQRDALGRRKAKIICTLGPSTDSDEVVDRLIAGGMDGARLNLSFGDIDEHGQRVDRLRRAEARSGRPVAIIADIPGRKLRIGRLEERRAQLQTGQPVSFEPDNGQSGNDRVLPAGKELFHENVMRGDKILLADGLVELCVSGSEPERITADVVYGGEVAEKTGIHAPSVPFRGEVLGEEDERLLRWAIQWDIDYLALTYVRDGTDILNVRQRVQDLGKNIPLIAKIERSEAFARLDGILNRADAVMIRRGDLGAEIEMAHVPLVQRQIVGQANSRGVPVIIATQMLGSMIRAPRPTRAEASDVSNSIAAGVDGVLLSAETAIGRFPIESTEMMHRIICETEATHGGMDRTILAESEPSPFPDTTASMACAAAVKTHAAAIACFTESGRTARLVAKYRPKVPIIAFCSNRETRRHLALNWGVQSDELEVHSSVEEMVARVDQRLVDSGLVSRGDRVVIVFGAPVGERGHTNSVRLHEIRGARSRVPGG